MSPALPPELSSELPRLDPLLHQPVRTQLVAFLSGRGEATFTELRRALGITDGNLGAHLNKLTEAGFIDSRDEASTGRSQRPQTVFSLTASGRQALAEYVQRLSALVQFSSPATAPTHNALDDTPHPTSLPQLPEAS